MDTAPHDEIEARLVARTPDRQGAYLRCDKGWCGLLDELDQQLVELFDDYEMHQCKQNFGALRYYTNIGEGSPQLSYCETWEDANP